MVKRAVEPPIPTVPEGVLRPEVKLLLSLVHITFPSKKLFPEFSEQGKVSVTPAAL